MNKITIIILALLMLTAGYSLGRQKQNGERFYTAVGKIESDSGMCLTASEIKAIQRAGVTDAYKNYLFEQDRRQCTN